MTDDELRALAEAADRIVFVPRERGNGGQPFILTSTFIALLDRIVRLELVLQEIADVLDNDEGGAELYEAAINARAALEDGA